MSHKKSSFFLVYFYKSILSFFLWDIPGQLHLFFHKSACRAGSRGVPGLFFFSGPGRVRWRPFSCSRWLLDNQKKVKSVASQKSTKNQEKKRQNEPHQSQAQTGAWGVGVANGYQESINRVSHRCQWSIRRG
jgi:hypothetical protein